MPFLLLLSFLFAVAAVVLAVIGLRDRKRAGAAPLFGPAADGDDLRRLLAHRLANGELSPDDYRARMQALVETGMVAVTADELLAGEDELYRSTLSGPTATAVGATAGPVTFGDPMFVTDPTRDAVPAATV